MCICPPMYTGSGYGPSGCTHLNATFDVCAHNPCQNGGTCLNIGILSFSCQCPVGTVRPLCTSANANPCANNPCRNGGTCISSTGNMLRFQCTCPQSHSGALCQNTVRQCGGAINGETGVLKYPLVDNNNYPHNSHCAWLIRTNASLVLNVTFTKFNLGLYFRLRPILFACQTSVHAHQYAKFLVRKCMNCVAPTSIRYFGRQTKLLVSEQL